jgi:hypothetical protein
MYTHKIKNEIEEIANVIMLSPFSRDYLTIQTPKNLSSLLKTDLQENILASISFSEPEVLNFEGARESIPRNQFRQAV